MGFFIYLNLRGLGYITFQRYKIQPYFWSGIKRSLKLPHGLRRHCILGLRHFLPISLHSTADSPVSERQRPHGGMCRQSQADSPAGPQRARRI